VTDPARPVILKLHPNGELDDLGVWDVDVDLERTGEARYAMRLRGAVTGEIALWTTRKQRVRVETFDPAPDWVALQLGPEGELQVLRASGCTLHFECMTRSNYYIGLTRRDRGLEMSDAFARAAHRGAEALTLVSAERYIPSATLPGTLVAASRSCLPRLRSCFATCSQSGRISRTSRIVSS
jgi:hypothetical protein